jgi:hypothetical protein
MIYAITEYRREGEYSPSIFRTVNLGNNFQIELHDLISKLLNYRQLSLQFLQNSLGFFDNRWIDVDQSRSFHVTIYENIRSFLDINQNYKKNKENIEYLKLKKQFLEIFKLTYIEHGYLDLDEGNEFGLLSVIDFVDNNLLIKWPEEISYKFI